MRNITRIALTFSAVFLAQITAAVSAEGRSAKPPVLVAQLGNLGPTSQPYGYQPYNDRNPTGFYHPNGMGYGSYYMTPKYHGHRIHALRYRKFRGY
ncbi:hypothetical protein [Lichenifustis flavocetrariae]|uniref:Uncharacterized protein n=1 Tax=Lichenifustis flavocetrariae TaxID=2949735 RepID=A0AA42CGX0_9HYPH|nr:hypothetical protein [Lichenifustis flavocetrariae]MCW6506664.1 hypothetical protein [Lichenifustis flavocetrariae]